MKHRTAQKWSVMRSLALLAAIFAVMVGATLPSAVAASPVAAHTVHLCSGEQIVIVDEHPTPPAHHDPAGMDGPKCAACLAGAFVALPPPPLTDLPAAPGLETVAHPRLASTAHRPAARLAPRPPSTAPPTA